LVVILVKRNKMAEIHVFGDLTINFSARKLKVSLLFKKLKYC
jgi:hypothetical protein